MFDQPATQKSLELYNFFFFHIIQSFIRADNRAFKIYIQSFAIKKKKMVALVAQDCYEAVIIGLGSRGQKTWFKSLRTSSKISVSAVCDSNAAVLDGFVSRYAETPAYSSLERLLEHHRPDFAIVCVPNKYHVPVIKHLEAARVPCLKEKPIAGTVEEFLLLCSLKTKIGVTFQRRWQPRYKHFSQLLAEIGRPLSVRATIVGHYDPPKDGWRVRHNVGTFVRHALQSNYH